MLQTLHVVKERTVVSVVSQHKTILLRSVESITKVFVA